jgi:hypothetical protein
MESIYHPYGSFRAGQTYMGSNATYIPTEVLNVKPSFWDACCKLMSHVAMFKLDNNASFSVDNVKFNPQTVTYLAPGSADKIQCVNDWMLHLAFGDTNAVSWFTNMNYLQQYQYTIFSNDPNLKSWESYDWFDVVQSSSSASTFYLVCGYYNESARNLRKLLYGCGYKLIHDSEPVSALPVFAFYKAYFDLFYPKRTMTWKDMACAGIQEYCEQFGQFSLDTFVLQNKPALLFQFILDLCTVYYTQSPDFVSSHISGQKIANVVEEVRRGPEFGGTPSLVGPNNYAGGTPSIGYETVDNISIKGTAISNNLLNQSNLDILQRMYHRINAKTAIGADIRAFLKTQLGVDYLDEDESYWIGANTLDININPVFSNAETSDGFLGEFAAQGSAGGSSDTWSYEAKVDGYWIMMATIVPDGRMCQGMDMNLRHVRKVDFFDHQYDSLTLVPTPKKYIFSERQFSQNAFSEDFNGGFGNMPNYIEYCVADNIQNGDISLMSKRASFLPFTLDKLLPYSAVRVPSSTEVIIENTSLGIIVNSELWRYVGYFKWLGQYARIFRNSGKYYPLNNSFSQLYNSMFYSRGLDDNFISHNRIIINTWNSKLPVRDSYQTGAFDKSSVAVEKA